MGARAEKSTFLIKFFQKTLKTTFLACFFLNTCPLPTLKKHLPPPHLIPPLHCRYNFDWWPLIWALSLGALNSFVFFSAIRERIHFSATRERTYFLAIRERIYFSAIRVFGSVTRHRPRSLPISPLF